MSSFWPKGIELTDTQSPREILKTAQEEWQTDSNGVMELVLQDAKSESGNPMIIVHAKHVFSKRTATLFSIVYRTNRPYPATVQPNKEELPEFLKKSYSVPGRVDISSMLATSLDRTEKTVTNKWVSDTPTEFRENLARVFNLGTIKSVILNLVSSSTENDTSANVQSTEDSEEE